jgi:hypothetical protein
MLATYIRMQDEQPKRRNFCLPGFLALAAAYGLRRTSDTNAGNCVRNVSWGFWLQLTASPHQPHR